MSRYLIVTIIFLIIIIDIGIETIIKNSDSLKKSISENNLISEIDNSYNNNLAHSDFFIDVWSNEQKAIGTELLEDAEYGHLIKDSSGNLYFPADDVDVTKYANETIKLNNLLKENNIPFLYVQAPNKMIEGYTSSKVFNYNFSNKNASEFLNLLKENGVNTLDLRETILSENIENANNLFYKTDHHWTTPTAFWAYKKIIASLKDTLNIDLDENNYYTNIENYESKTIKQCFLGSLGRRVGEAVAGLDDYVYISPKFETNYELYNGVVSKENSIKQGNFNKAITIDSILNSNDVKSNKHATYFEWDYGDLIIKNKSITNGKKVLLIKDSYGLPVGAFMSTCVSELHMVDLRDTPRVYIDEYIKENDIDVVILLYNTEVFNDKMFDFFTNNK